MVAGLIWYRWQYFVVLKYWEQYMSSLLIPLGATLRQARCERGLTQAVLAERAGIPRLKVIQVEAGDDRVASRYYALVAGALGQRLGLQVARRPTLEELEREQRESSA